MWQYKFSQRVTVKFAILVSTVVLSPYIKGSEIFSDEVFNIADWQLVTEQEGNGGSLSFSQEPTGGNTDEYLRITLTIDAAPPYSVVFGAFFRTGATYDPQTQGEIVTLEYSEDSIMFVGFDDGQHSGLALRQNGIIYYANFPYPGVGLIQSNQSSWTRQSFISLIAEDFGRPNTLSGPYTPDLHPDFSSGGAPIEFGFYRADTTPSFSYSIIAGIDNWSVTVNNNSPSITPLNNDIPWLHVEGNKIKDPDGNVVVLRGISLIDLGFIEEWRGGAINMINRITDKDNSQGSSPGWYPKVIRIPITPPDQPDKESDWPHPFDPHDDSLYNDLLRPVVDCCAAKDLYVIIDWHYIADTEDKRDQTSQFWYYMAHKFANDSNVLFELFNEPINTVFPVTVHNSITDTARWLIVKDDMEIWVDIIRKYAPKNLILVGGPEWSRIIGPAATFPVSGDNIVYVCHIYPDHWLGQDGDWLREQIKSCSDVHPVIMTEWGFSMTSKTKDPSPNLKSTISAYGKPLMDFLERHGISNTAFCADYEWAPPMFWEPNDFNGEWIIRCGEDEMGCFVKDTLYKKRNDDQPLRKVIVPINLDLFEDFETGNLCTLSWICYYDRNWIGNADKNWFVTSEEKNSGKYCARAGPISHNESSALRITLDCISGDISFYYKVSSEQDGDFLEFCVDGVIQDKWSGEEDWTKVSFPVSEGARTFGWTYSKNNTASVGNDTAWIDDIVFPPLKTEDDDADQAVHDIYANSVVDFLITASLQDPLEGCLGAPDEWSIALGDGGWIVLDMGLGEAIVDGEGADLIVYEDPFGFWAEGYAVYGSNNADGPWALIGIGFGTQEFDLADGSGLETSRYIKVVDDNDWPWTWPWEGFDIDAVEALNMEQ